MEAVANAADQPRKNPISKNNASAVIVNANIPEKTK
jgi:hypothetical protein